ncbi:MAG TPA: LytTR family DNA-binding domain-containing protein [Gemmatimonadaceae bacterium]|nr:LytTR family DNA-binding domain-containing protein [Gemmatimonadaceae bacterium]
MPNDTGGQVTALVVDDEPIARAGLRAMLAQVEWVRCIGEAGSGPAAVQAINDLRPELVFLDVQMPGLLGTDVLRRVRHHPFVVFTTAYAQHAVTAFELGALDYLLKPFGAQRLGAALERVRAAIGEPVMPSPIDRLSESLASGPMTRLFVRSGRSIVPVPVSTITWFEALGDYVAAHVGRTRHVLHLSLNRLEARLDPTRFVRLHRTNIVNLDHVVAFRRAGKGKMVAELDDGTRVPVSRTKAQEVRAQGV